MMNGRVSRGCVLVVDDEPSARTGLGRLLEDENFEVRLATDGHAALKIAMEGPLDIVITDLRMPDMDGTDLCRRLHVILPDVPVIVVTGFGDMRSAVDAIRVGAEDYLTKPLDFDAVLLSVQRAIERRAEQVEREQLTRQAQELYRDAQATMHAYQEALSIVAHDLRNPLSVLHFRVTELSRMTLPSEPKKNVLRIAASLGRVTAQMRYLVDDLIDVRNVSMGTVRLDRIDCDARALLMDVAELRPLALQKHVALRVRAPADVCMVYGDRQRLGQALNNLVANAIKFSRSGTEIDVSLEKVNGGMEFIVRDEGPGIAGDEVARVFDRFWQGKERRSGVGLGLFIAKRVVDAHGGRIWVDSRPGVGSTFHIFVPSSPAASSPRARADTLKSFPPRTAARH